MAASQTRDMDALTKEGVEKALNDLSDMGFEYIVCDSGRILGMLASNQGTPAVHMKGTAVSEA